jgi:hypothetical protein
MKTIKSESPSLSGGGGGGNDTDYKLGLHGLNASLPGQIFFACHS